MKGKRGNPPECCGSSCGHLLAEAPDSPSRPRALHIIPSPQSTGSLQKPQPLGLNFLLLLQLLGCCFLLITRFSEQGPEGELCFCKLSCISSNKAFCLAPSLSSAPPPPRPVLTPLKATQEVVHVELLCGSAAFYCPVGLTLFFRKSRVVRASDENSFVEHQLVFSRFAYASGNHRTEGSFCFRFPFGSAVSAGVYRTITSWFLGRMGQGGREWADPCFLSGIKNA